MNHVVNHFLAWQARTIQFYMVLMTLSRRRMEGFLQQLTIAKSIEILMFYANAVI